MRKEKHEKGNGKKYGYFYSIRFRLCISYIIMIIFIILTGFLAEKMGEQAIEESYRDTVTQSLRMVGKYIEFGFENVRGTVTEYLVDKEISNYVSGKMSSDPSAETRYQTALEKQLNTKITADEFISDIYFVTEGVYAVTTRERAIKTLFSSYMDTEQGENIRENENQFFWMGRSSIVDEELEVDSDKYAVRLIKYFNQKNAVIMVDIDCTKITEILNGIDLGDGSHITYITDDGVELAADGTRTEFFSSMDCYLETHDSEEKSGIIENVQMDGKSYLYLYEKLKDSEGTICALVPNDVIYEKVYAIRNVTIAVVVIACIFALFIGGGITFSFNRSINYFIFQAWG